MRNRQPIRRGSPLATMLVLSAIQLHSAIAFSPSPNARLLAPNICRHTKRHQPLWYRELEEDDDDTTMLKVQTRAPPGFDMKENLSKRGPTSAKNLRLIAALLINQGLIFIIATFVLGAILAATEGFSAFAHVPEILRWSDEGAGFTTLSPFVTGILGAVPMLAIGNLIEDSDNRAFSNVNFSTVTMVLTLFGRRKAPPPEFVPDRLKGTQMPTTSTTDVILWSLLLASATAICEETIFRMEIPAMLNQYFGGYPYVPLIGQAALFGLGHVQAKTGFGENTVVAGLQMTNGLLSGMLYLLTGGDLVPCIISHTVYDFVVFFKTWLDANTQMEYAETMFLEPLPSPIQNEVDQVLRSLGTNIDPRVLSSVKRLFYLFDYDKNSTLSKSEVRKGFSYLAIEKAGVPPPQNEVDALFDTYTSGIEKNRLTFADFLRLYTTSGAFKQKEGARG